MSEQNKPMTSNHAGLTDWQILCRQSQTLVESDFLPKSVSTWQKALAITMYGKELGMGPMEAMQSIDVIQGKPTQKPQSMKALVHKKLPGAIFRPVRMNADECVYEAARPGDPVIQISFSIKEAERLGLLTKDNWKKQPEVMLNWRCVGKVARTIFPDCLSGVSYTPEELGAVVDDEHNILTISPEKKIDEKAEDDAKLKALELRAEHEEKKKAIDAFREAIKQLKDTGFKDAEIFTQLKIESYNDIVLKDSKTIYAAIGVLHEAAAK